MAAWWPTIAVDCSDIVEAVQEAGGLARRLGDRMPPHIRSRCEQLSRREGGFFEIKSEIGADKTVTIRVVAGHELLCLLADLRAQVDTG